MLTREELRYRAARLTDFIEEAGDTWSEEELYDFVSSNYDSVKSCFTYDDTPLAETITLYSSHGVVVADLNGKVIKATPYGCGSTPEGWALSGIRRLDVVEWAYSHPLQEIAGEHDILDFGYWDFRKNYERPCYSWRKERERMQFEDDQF